MITRTLVGIENTEACHADIKSASTNLQETVQTYNHVGDKAT